MNHLSIYTLLSFCLFFSACTASKKKDQKTPNENQTESLKQTMPPAPGSVQVTAEILSLEEMPQGFHCDLKIITVHGYGASTPPLPEGTKITASVRKEILDGTAPAGEESFEVVSSGMVKFITLKYQQAMDLPGASPTSWRILSIR